MGGIATNGSLLTGRTIEYYKAQPPAFVMRVFQRPPSLLLKTSFNVMLKHQNVTQHQLLDYNLLTEVRDKRWLSIVIENKHIFVKMGEVRRKKQETNRHREAGVAGGRVTKLPPSRR